jgi:hypothetical protein
MFKFEMQVGWLGNGTVKIETNDFDIIETLKDFIEFQEGEGWIGAYEFSTIDEEAEEEEAEEVEDETDEVEDDEPATVSTYIITKIEE